MNLKKKSGFEVMRKLIVLLKPLMIYMVLAITTGVLGFLMSTALGALGGLGLVQLMKLPTDHLWLGNLSLQKIGVCLIILAIVRSFLQYAEQLANHFIAFKILAELRHKIFHQLKKLAPAKLESKQSGELIRMVTSDIELLEVFYAHTISPICIAMLTCLLIVSYLWSIHPIYAFIAMFFFFWIGVIVPIYAQRKGKEKSRQVRAGLGKVSHRFLEGITGIGELLQYGYGETFVKELYEETKAVTHRQKELKKEVGMTAAMIDSSIVVSILVSIVATILLYPRDLQGMASGFIATLVIMSSFGPVVALASLGNTLLPTLAAGERVLGLLEERPEVEPVVKGEKPKLGDIEFSHIDFAYEDEIILKDFSMTIKQGERVGIQGKSGCGKSTLLKLLMRFWDINQGQLSISNTSIQEINSEYLKQQMCYMTQSTVLFTGTLRDNLKVGKMDATDEELMVACQKASVSEFIKSLPKGLDTWIEDLGTNLSGGERQRIGLARCFLSNRPILLLDEPTSNLDRINEGIILKALEEETKEKTLIMVSHRASSLGIVDRIISLARS